MLKREIEVGTAQLAELEALRVSAARTQDLVGATAVDADLVALTLTTATFLERRDVERALTHAIELDPDAGEGRITFFAIPGVAAVLDAGVRGLGVEGRMPGAQPRGTLETTRGAQGHLWCLVLR